jgi:hypothetical protein
MVSQHRRFELLDVVFADVSIGKCTIDLWVDDRGQTQWAARVLMPRGHGSTIGQLMGRTRDGGWLSGPATFATHQDGPRGGRTVLVELHGTGTLEPTEAPPPAAPVSPAPGAETVEAVELVPGTEGDPG